MKTCPSCQASKPLSDFYKDKCAPSGVTSSCRVCLKARRADYYAANKEAVIARAKRWAEANPERVTAIKRAWRIADAGTELGRSRQRHCRAAHREENPHKAAEYTAKYRAANPEKCAAYGVAYRLANPEKFAVRTMLRRARKLRATPSWFGEFDLLVIHEAYALAKSRECLFGFKWHVDHIIPLQSKLVCGLHCAPNLRVIPATVNQKKNNKFEVA